MVRGDVAKVDIFGQRAEQWNSLTDEHGNSRDREAVNLAGPEEVLDGDSSVDVGMLDASCGQLRNNFCGGAGHLLDFAALHFRKIQRAAAQNYDSFVAVGPFGKSEDDLEGFSADHNGIDAGEELGVAVRFAAIRRKKVESIVRTRDEAVDAGADEYGSDHANAWIDLGLASWVIGVSSWLFGSDLAMSKP